MQHVHPLRAAALATAAVVAIAACASKESSSAARTRAAVAAPPVASQTGHDNDSKDSTPNAPVADATKNAHENAADNRKVIRTGRVVLVVASYDDARAALDALVAKAGGYVDSTQVMHGQGAASSASIVVRVPSANFGTFIPKLRALGDVRSEQTSGDDITDEYVDLEARLANARTLEQRLLELASARNGSIDQVLAVESELAKVRGEIEGYQGRQRVWDNQVAMSTLAIDMTTKQPEIAAAPAESLGERIASTFRSSIAALRDVCAWLLVNGLALLPWLLLIVPAWIVVRRLVRRVRLPRATIAKQAPERSA